MTLIAAQIQLYLLTLAVQMFVNLLIIKILFLIKKFTKQIVVCVIYIVFEIRTSYFAALVLGFDKSRKLLSITFARLCYKRNKLWSTNINIGKLINQNGNHRDENWL